MTKQLREKLIPRRTSLLPRISSSYDENHIEVVDTANGNNRKNSIKLIECICKFIHILSTIILFSYPLVIIIAASLLYDSMIVIAVAFGLVLFKILVLDFYLFKMGKIQNWPNKVSKKRINYVSYFQTYLIAHL
jgi:ABC-type multidrug transport system fused ATPase/permease subunit